MAKRSKSKKSTYTVRLEWPVTYYVDMDGIEASSPEEAAAIALEDPDYDAQSSYDESGDTYVAGITNEDTGAEEDVPPTLAEDLTVGLEAAEKLRAVVDESVESLEASAPDLARKLRMAARCLHL